LVGGEKREENAGQSVNCLAKAKKFSKKPTRLSEEDAKGTHMIKGTLPRYESGNFTIV